MTDGADALARQLLDRALEHLRAVGAAVDGDVRDPGPLQAVRHTLGRFPADEVVISTLQGGLSRWLRRDLPARLRKGWPGQRRRPWEIRACPRSELKKSNLVRTSWPGSASWRRRAGCVNLTAMSWRPGEAYLRGLDFFSDVVAEVPKSAWNKPSPCRGWRVIDVLGHVGTAVVFGTTLLRGEDPAWKPVEPPGKAVHSDPAAWWLQLTEPAREAVRGADLGRVVDSPMGRRSIGEGLSFPAVDLFVHAWDLGRGAGIHVELPVEAMEFAHAVIDPIPDEQKRSPRVFAEQVPLSADATASQAFLAWTGRDPAWTAAA